MFPTPSRTINFLIGLAVLIASSVASADAQELGQEADLDRLKFDETLWHGMYLADSKSGYLNTTNVRRNKDGKETIAILDNFAMKLVSLDQKVNMEFIQEIEFDAKPPYRMLNGSVKVLEGDSKMEINAVVEGTTLTATITSGEAGTVTQKLENFEYTLLTASKLELLDWSKIQVGDVLEVNEFDLSELHFDKQTYTVKKIKNAPAGGVAFKYFETEAVSELMGNLGPCRFSDSGDLLSAKMGGIIEARKENEKTAKDITYSADLFVRGTLRINKPIGDPDNIVALETKINERVAEAIEIGPMQNVEKRDDDYVLTLGKVYGKERPFEDGDIEENLKETAVLPVNHETITKLVKEAIGDESDPEKKVKRLISFVSEYIEDSYSANAFSVLDVCKNRKGDCTEHSMLFATMARTAGIPCREVSGFVYMGDEIKAFGGHAWNEVILDGKWWPVDATWDEFTVNPTHIQIKKQSEIQIFGMGMRMRLLKLETN